MPDIGRALYKCLFLSFDTFSLSRHGSPLYSQWIHCKAPSGHLKPQTVPNPTCTMLALDVYNYDKFHVFSILTKHLSHIRVVTFTVWGATAKLASFLLYDFAGRRFILTVDLSNLSIWFFLSLLSWEISPFHLKEARSSFSLAYPNCQHHCFCDVGPLLSDL